MQVSHQLNHRRRLKSHLLSSPHQRARRVWLPAIDRNDSKLAWWRQLPRVATLMRATTKRWTIAQTIVMTNRTHMISTSVMDTSPAQQLPEKLAMLQPDSKRSWTRSLRMRSSHKVTTFRRRKTKVTSYLIWSSLGISIQRRMRHTLVSRWPKRCSKSKA